MSEYQYYEWQTIDRPLTAAEQRAVDGLSSHMDTVTSTQAVVTYSWGNFKHDPAEVLLQYFDAFLYDSNFGYRRLMFRLPKSLVDVEAMRAYCLDDWIALEEHGPYFILEITWNDENNDYEWIESDGMLGQLTCLREQILQGDYRALYIVWLKAMDSDRYVDEDDEPGPPVPAGLQNLNAGLQALMEFFEINPHLVAAAAASSPKASPEPDLESAVPKLTRAEADDHLRRIARGEPGAVLLLKKRLAALSDRVVATASPAKRTVAEMRQQAEEIEREARRKAAEEAERQRIQRLEKLAEREGSAWAKVESLLEQKRGGAYEEATQLLVELKEMAEYKKQTPQFQKFFEFIRAKYGKSVALMGRFRRAGLA